MKNDISITILVDDQPNGEKLLTEHGFALWIEFGGKRILFDCGQSDYCIQNAEQMGIDIGTADVLVVSHGHYDHTGGIPEVLKRNPRITVYCHPGIFMPRYSRQHDGTIKPVGINRNTSDALNKVIDRIQWVSGITRITDFAGITGPIPRLSSFEDTGGAFFLDPIAKRPDPVTDDCAMWFTTAEGLVIVTGCCHSGIVNTLQFIDDRIDATRVHTVIGGLHLLNASSERIDSTGDYIRTKGIGRIIPCHCTGDGAVIYLTLRFGSQVVPGKVGDSVRIGAE